jgi:serine phosphatase RsbU (regulator of sigma subunit)/pSer/pThr/pTyr-binding forkhead associated (FHA) protein
MPTLEVLDGKDKGKVYTIQRDETVLGRLAYCDVVFAQKNISRQHTRVVRSGGEYYVEDLNSTNGTFLNGKRVRKRTRLQDQDLIRVYDITVMFREVAEEVQEPAAPKGPETQHIASAPTGVQRGAPMTGMGTTQAAAATNLRQDVGVNAYEKLRTVLEINRTLGTTLDIDLVLPKILDSMLTVFPQTDRAYILFPDEATGQLQVRAEKRKEEGTMVSTSLGPISQTVANRVLSQGEAILSADGFDQGQFDIADSVLDFPIRSMMCAPLIGPMNKPLGIIYVDTNDPFERFHEDDLEMLLSLAATAGQAVEYANTHQAQLRLDRRERELATAKEVQLHFLPQSAPDVPGYRFFDYYSSAEEVGGDYYGYVNLPDGRLAITLGDVSGKGITAALIMARLCSDVRYQLAIAADPIEAVHHLNVEYCKPENETWFVTFVLCILDPRTNRVGIINAGHMPPLRKCSASGDVEELGKDASGPPLGCDASIRYVSSEVQLEPGDSLLMYTDGINEAMDPERTLYGMTRVRETLKKGPPSLEELCRCLLADVRTFTQNQPQNDDVCLIGVQRQ